MRKLDSFFLCTAVVIASLASCQKELSDPNENTRTVQFTVKASLDPHTKTYLSENGGVYSAKWSYNPSNNVADQIGVFFGEFQNNVTTTDAVFSITNVTDDVATFSGQGTVSDDEVTFTSFYPATAFTRTFANNCVGVKVEKTQSPVLGSFDPKMDILIGKQKNITIASTNVVLNDLQFSRVMAILRVNVNAKNEQAVVAGKTITSLKLVAEGTTLTGTASVSAGTGEISSWTQSNDEVIASIDPTELITVNESDGVNSVYLIVNPTTISAGTSLSFTVGMSDGTTYTRILTAPEMEFLAAKVTEINLTIRDKDLVEDDYSGNYLIVSKGSTTNWVVMNKSLTANNSSSYLGATATEVSYNDEVNFESSSVTFGDYSDAEHKWILNKVSNGYTIKNTDGKYIGVTSKTYATLNSEQVTLKVESEGNNVYAITNSDATLALKYNSNSPRFTFYDSGQQDIYLIPFVETCKAPAITCSNNTVTITCGTTDACVYYTVDGTTTPTSSSTLYTEPFEITANTTVKAIAIKNGIESSKVTTTLCEYNAGGPDYVKVSAEQTDWSGTYILTNADGNCAFTGTISTTSTKYGLYTSITTTDSGNKIESNSTNDEYAIVVAKSGDHYTMQIATGAYLYWHSGNSLNADNTLQNNEESLWDFNYSSSCVVISNVKDSDRVIRFNSDRFACYTSGAGVSTSLYKYSDGKSNANVTLNYEGTITFSDSNIQLTINKPEGLALSFSSSDTNIAEVNNDGSVTIKGAGSAIITASWIEQTISETTYRAGSVNYNLTVNKATPTVAFSEPTTSVEVNGEVTNKATTNPSGLTVSYSSNNTNVATVDSSTGKVTGVANGKATITASFAGNENYVAVYDSYEITVGTGSEDYTAVDPYTFVFSEIYDSNTMLDGDSIEGTNCSIVFNKGDGGTATQYYKNGSAVRWYGGGTLQVTAPTGYKITKIKINFSRTDNTVSANVGTYTQGTWTGTVANGSSVTFTQSGTSGQNRITSIEINNN